MGKSITSSMYVGLDAHKDSIDTATQEVNLSQVKVNFSPHVCGYETSAFAGQRVELVPQCEDQVAVRHVEQLASRAARHASRWRVWHCGQCQTRYGIHRSAFSAKTVTASAV